MASKQKQNQASQPQHTPSPTELLLRDRSTRLVHSMNDRTFPTVATELMHPDYAGYHDMDQTPWRVISREDVISQMMEFLHANPNFHTDILDMSVSLDEDGGKAKVWMRRTDTGLVVGPKRETVMEFEWEQREGEWGCKGYQGMRSFAFYGV